MKKMAKCRSDLYRRLFRTVDIPQDLAPVTDVDTAAEIDPRQVGLDQESVDRIWDACQNLYRSGVYPLLSLGLAIVVRIKESYGTIEENEILDAD